MSFIKWEGENFTNEKLNFKNILKIKNFKFS